MQKILSKACQTGYGKIKVLEGSEGLILLFDWFEGVIDKTKDLIEIYFPFVAALVLNIQIELELAALVDDTVFISKLYSKGKLGKTVKLEQSIPLVKSEGVLASDSLLPIYNLYPASKGSWFVTLTLTV